MNIPKDLQQFVGEQLLLGNYSSVDDLLIEALTLLRDARHSELINAIEIGRIQIENGECVELRTESDVDEYFAGIMRRDPANPAEPAA